MDQVVFLDRDGVINEKAPPHEYILSRSDFRFLPGVPVALRRLRAAGFKLVLITNQRCIARGLATMEEINLLHGQMCSDLRRQGADMDAIFVCPHGETGCDCRKPEIGLFLQAERQFPVDKENSWMIGDSASDIEAGKRYGVQTILVNNFKDTCGDFRCKDLPEAADLILNRSEICRF